MNFQSFDFALKTGSHLDSPCSLADTKLESGKEQEYAFN
jgi:hypothetical protein